MRNDATFSTTGIIGANIGKPVEDKEPVPQEAGVVFETGMKLTEFLRANPTIRNKEDVLKYFSEDVIQRAVRIGAVAYMHGRLVL